LTVIIGVAGMGSLRRWQKYQMERLELEQTTASLETQRILLRRSEERLHADAGLSLSDDAAGGELAVGQHGELSEDR
jgi:hypothetical protein